jgi:licheninase
LPADTLDGGQIESKNLYGPGFYAARIKVPDAPSSITGFFLYEPPDYASEIDIEIYNDSSGKVLFTTYAGGKRTHTETVGLPFDPTQDFHDYAFFYDRDSITFYVDGEPMKEHEGGLPDQQMKLYVNSWFPTWLSGEKPGSDRYSYVDWIER